MELISELVKLLLPAALVMWAMYLTIRSLSQKEITTARSFFENQAQIREAEREIQDKELQLKNREQVLPIRFQAYERMCLFLERISPAQLVPRMNNPEFSVGLFQQVLLQEIRNEFAHNLSQQMYMSNDAWLWIKKAMEETVVMINNSATSLDEDAPGIELAKRILENARDHDWHPSQDALLFLKEEIRQFF